MMSNPKGSSQLQKTQSDVLHEPRLRSILFVCVITLSCIKLPSRSGCGSCGRIRCARRPGCATSLSCNTLTVTKSMNVIPATQCRSIVESKSFPAHERLSSKFLPSSSMEDTSSHTPSITGSKNIFKNSKTPTLTTADTSKRGDMTD